MNQAELDIIHADWLAAFEDQRPPGSWRSLVRREEICGCSLLSAMTCGYMVYIYMTWFYTYLVEQRHLTQMASSYYTIGPFIAMAILTPIGGIASDVIARKINLALGRAA